WAACGWRLSATRCCTRWTCPLAAGGPRGAWRIPSTVPPVVPCGRRRWPWRPRSARSSSGRTRGRGRGPL
ncbi:MAG: hypothetical protein AVDCRST_MAG25-2847, partial [uncultured Rubrobacteraceae bacterium]